MSTQIAVRLSDDSVAFIDDAVADGTARSRAAYLDRLVRRERRRAADEKAVQDGRYEGLLADGFEAPEAPEGSPAVRNAAEIWSDLD